MTSIIENEVLESLIATYEHHLDRLRIRRSGPGKKEVIRQMEETLQKAKACLPQQDEEDYVAADFAFDADREDRFFGK